MRYESPLSYSRKNLELALWNTLHPGKGSPPSKRFLSRLKHLIDIDRDLDPAVGGRPASPFAFRRGGEVGTGYDVPYNHLDGFMLALGLDFLDSGFKQSEVVFLLRYLRSEVERYFYKSIAEGDDRADYYVCFDEGASKPRMNSSAVNDNRFFILVRRFELSDEGPGTPNRARWAPFRIVKGISELQQEFDTMSYPRHKAFVIEAAWIANAVTGHLRKTKQVRKLRS